ncbi:MAG TPA: hypothetical protein VGE96_02150, partial [Steroidobacteraceae bacterium]
SYAREQPAKTTLFAGANAGAVSKESRSGVATRGSSRQKPRFLPAQTQARYRKNRLRFFPIN